MTLRREDDRLLRGAGRFVDDVDRPGQLWMRVVRSPAAHARILSIGVDEAASAPGVVAVLTAADFAPVPVIPVRVGPRDRDHDSFLQPVIADTAVRYVGEPVAVVLADDPYRAEDAGELVDVALTPLEPVLDAERGAAAVTLTRRYGDVAAAFAAADAVIESTYRVGRHSAVPLECRGLVAEPRAGGGLTVWGATKVPHFNRDVIAGILGLDPAGVVMRAGDAGGGFGVRGELYPEDVLVCVAAQRFGRPVKWVEDRVEHLVAANHSREQTRRLAGAFDAEGRLLGLRDLVFHDNGAYLRTHGVLVPELTLSMLPGPYRVPAYEGVAHVVLTNKTPCGTYRAPGRYECTFARERLLDLAAYRLEIDPIELRRRNLLRPDELPKRRPLPVLGHEVELDDGRYGELLERALESAPYDGWRREVDQLRADGKLAGIGVAVFLEKSGGGGSETATVSLAADGLVTVAVGATSLGQGVETVVARIAAAELGVAEQAVLVVGGDTAAVPHGVGSWASRSTIYAGAAVAAAARAVAASGAASETRTVAGEPMTYPYGVHLALVEVDPDTGRTVVRRFHVAYDVGRAIDRTLVEGQLRGGAAQGVGGALFEEFAYDDEGQPRSASFLDYLIPTAAETPAVTVCLREDAPARGTALGAKGAGEGGVTAAGAAIAAAVDDALGVAGAIESLPIRPDTVLGILRTSPSRAT